MPCVMEIDPTTKKGTLWFHKGAQVVTSKTVGSAVVGFDSGGIMVSAVVPNAFASTNLTSLPYETKEDHDHVHQVLGQHNIKSGG